MLSVFARCTCTEPATADVGETVDSMLSAKLHVQKKPATADVGGTIDSILSADTCRMCTKPATADFGEA